MQQEHGQPAGELPVSEQHDGLFEASETTECRQRYLCAVQVFQKVVLKRWIRLHRSGDVRDIRISRKQSQDLDNGRLGGRQPTPLWDWARSKTLPANVIALAFV